MTDTKAHVVARWSVNRRGYLDKHGRLLTVVKTAAGGYRNLDPSDPTKPILSPRNPDATIIGLPAELRLQIFENVLADQEGQSDGVQDDMSWRMRRWGLARPLKYAYLYRSPGRLMKLGRFSPQELKLLSVCWKFCNELLDLAFSGKVFLLEASLYPHDVKGLSTIPAVIPQAGLVRRLLVFTVLDLSCRDGNKVADLEAIQKMTGLRELRVIFTVTRVNATADMIDAAVSTGPVLTLLSCVPMGTRVYLGCGDKDWRDELTGEVGEGLDYMFVPDEYANRALSTTRAKAKHLNNIELMPAEVDDEERAAMPEVSDKPGGGPDDSEKHRNIHEFGRANDTSTKRASSRRESWTSKYFSFLL